LETRGLRPGGLERENIVNNLVPVLIWVAVISVLFGVAWYMGYITRLRDYVAETREELRKCTWPTWDELKGSTTLILVSIVLIGGFTVVVDLACNFFVRLIT
jgi:preprotein translocase subunit SecE